MAVPAVTRQRAEERPRRIDQQRAPVKQTAADVPSQSLSSVNALDLMHNNIAEAEASAMTEARAAVIVAKTRRSDAVEGTWQALNAAPLLYRQSQKAQLLQKIAGAVLVSARQVGHRERPITDHRAVLFVMHFFRFDREPGTCHALFRQICTALDHQPGLLPSLWDGPFSLCSAEGPMRRKRRPAQTLPTKRNHPKAKSSNTSLVLLFLRTTPIHLHACKVDHWITRACPHCATNCLHIKLPALPHRHNRPVSFFRESRLHRVRPFTSRPVTQRSWLRFCVFLREKKYNLAF